MLALGVVGLTTYRLSKLKEIYDQNLRELRRAQHRLRVSAKLVELADEASAGSKSGEPDIPLVQFSIELLCDCAEEDTSDKLLKAIPIIMQTDFVSLTWTNMSAVKDRVALVNYNSSYLDNLLKRALGELELAGFAFYTGDDTLHSSEAADLLKRIADALHSANKDPIASWLIYGAGVQEIAQADAAIAVRVHSVEEEPVPADHFFLPGGNEGIYELAWLNDSVHDTSSQLMTKVTGLSDSVADTSSQLMTKVSDSVADTSGQLMTKVTGVLDNISISTSGWDWSWSSPSSGKGYPEKA